MTKTHLPHEDTAESQLSQTIRQEHYALIGKFTDGIVHNLNNPLNAVSGLVQLMAMRNPESQELERLDVQIEQLAEQIRELGQRFRKFHEPVSGHLWSQLLQAELLFFNAKAQIKHHCELELQLDADIPCPITWPEATWLVDQVLLALIDVIPCEGMRKLIIGVEGGWPFFDLAVPGDAVASSFDDVLNHPIIKSLLAPYGVCLSFKPQPQNFRIFFTLNNEA